MVYARKADVLSAVDAASARSSPRQFGSDAGRLLTVSGRPRMRRTARCFSCGGTIAPSGRVRDACSQAATSAAATRERAEHVRRPFRERGTPRRVSHAVARPRPARAEVSKVLRAHRCNPSNSPESAQIRRPACPTRRKSRCDAIDASRFCAFCGRSGQSLQPTHVDCRHSDSDEHTVRSPTRHPS